MKKITAQQVYEAYKQAIDSLNGAAFFQEMPATWEEVSEQHKAIFRDMAWRMNLIIGEFETA